MPVRRIDEERAGSDDDQHDGDLDHDDDRVDRGRLADAEDEERRHRHGDQHRRAG